MQRCPHCQFPVTRLAKTCGWCGAELRSSLPSMLAWFPWSQGQSELQAKHDKSRLIGIPGMPPLSAEATQTAPEDDPAATLAASGTGVTARARIFSPQITPATTLAGRSRRTPTQPVKQQPV